VTKAADVALLVLDVDGVLTDGRLWFGPDGESLKAFHVRDGHGIKALLAAGIGVAVISGRRSAAVAARMRELGVADVAQGVDDKSIALAELIARSAVDGQGAVREFCDFLLAARGLAS
jgi:3-deoxy-D-manno-octulosonate 8-phosphate phosphatase (KDO 8-P phosphatase)